MFTQRTLESIRERLNIVDLVGEYVELKKSGSGFAGRCPFHKEKTPSFHVHPTKQVFHCFGCQKGGNVFTFLREMEGLSFPQAVEKLAARAGVEIEQDPNFKKTRRDSATESESSQQEIQALEWATKYFHHLLMKVPEYAPYKKYLEERGLTQKTIEKFQLGVSPKGWNTLRDLMLKRGYNAKTLVSAGLVVEKTAPATGSYDRFRERIMFPIRGMKGHVIGFGARIFKEEKNQPKYLNSSDSPLFSKRCEMYGFFENQRDIRLRGEAIIVEGYMDVVGLYEKGVNNAIATMGTALTSDHCYTIRQQCRRVVTVFDPDEAGRDAWHRSVDLFIDNGIFAKDLALPEGLDPDEYVLREGAEKFYELCEKAPRQITKLLREFAQKGALSEEAKAELLKKFTPVLIASRKLPDRALIWDSLSLIMNVSVEALSEIARPPTTPGTHEKQPQRSFQPPPRRAPAPLLSTTTLDEQFFAACLISRPQFQKDPVEAWREGLRDDTFRSWLEKLYAADNDEKWAELLNDMTSAEAPEAIARPASGALMAADSGEPGNGEMYEALRKRVADRAREGKIRSLSKQVRLAQQMGDGAWLPLLEKLKELRGDT